MSESAASHHDHGAHHHAGHDHAHGEQSLNRMSVAATLHCMTGCAIGEVLGLALATAFGWGNAASFALAISLAFLFSYLLTSLPLLKAGLALGAVVPIALATDTFSITTMEMIDNLTMAVIPGAMDAGLADVLFWAAMVGGFVVAFPFTFLVNRALLRRGKGHALVHAYHQH